MQIKDSVIIVTGASSGIGLVTARLLAEQGARVVLAARSTEALDRLAGELPGSLAVTVDMTDLEGVRRMVEQVRQHYGRIDGLVNNAGRGYQATIEQSEPEAFEEIFRLNVLGPLVAMQAVLPAMRAQGSGAIVNISSGTSLMQIPGYAIYSSSKRALNGISLTAREELAKEGITVSLVYPGVTATNFGVNKQAAASLPEEAVRRDYSAGDPPELIAGLIATALEEGGAEYFAHPQMRPAAGR